MNQYCVSILFIYKCFRRTKNICHRKASYRNFQDFLSTQQHFFSKKVKWLHSNSPLCSTYFVQHEKARKLWFDKVFEQQFRWKSLEFCANIGKMFAQILFFFWFVNVFSLFQMHLKLLWKTFCNEINVCEGKRSLDWKKILEISARCLAMTNVFN